MSLDLYLVRCQRNALWAALPLAVLVAFAAVAMLKSRDGQESIEQFVALAPIAFVLVVLTYRLAANSGDLLQRVIALALALLGGTAFVLALAFTLNRWGATVDLTVLALFGLVLAAWSLLAAVLIPCRPRDTGRLAWWRLTLVVALAGLLPVATALLVDVQLVFGSTALVLLLSAPVAVALAPARSGSALGPIVSSAMLGAVVGAVVDMRSPRDAVPWTAECALLYALGGVAVHVASRARAMTAVRELDGEPVRLPRIPGESLDERFAWVLGRLMAGSLVFALAVWLFVARSKPPRTSDPVVRAGIASLGGALESFQKVAGAARPSAAASGAPRTPNGGIELACAAFRGQNWSISDGDSELPEGDTDDDGQTEYLDAWGNPFVYFDSSEYTAAGNGVVYVRGDGATVTATPLLDATTGEFFRPDTFQIFSMGPDGMPDTADDFVYGR